MKLLEKVINVINVCGLAEWAKEVRYVRDHMVMSTVYVQVRTRKQMEEMCKAFCAYADFLDISSMTTETGVQKPIHWNHHGLAEVSEYVAMGPSVEDDQYFCKVHLHGDGTMIQRKHDWSDPEALKQGKAFLSDVTMRMHLGVAK